MRRMMVVLRREYAAAVRTKGFIIGLILAPILIGGSGLAMILLRGQVDTAERRVVVVDRSGVVAAALVQAADQRNRTEAIDSTTGERTLPAYLLSVEQPDVGDPDAQRLRLSERVRTGELHGYVEIGVSVLHPGRDSVEGRVTYHAKNPVVDDVRRWLNGPLNERIRLARLEEAGVSQDEVPDLFRWVSAEALSLVSADDAGGFREAERQSETGALIVPLIVGVLMVIMIVMGAAPQLNAVMEEKNQRIAEVVLGLATPFEFMMGKVLAGLCVSLTASAIYIVTAVLVLSAIGLEGALPLQVVPWFFIFLVFAILMMGAVYAALGSLCNDMKDAQNLTLPGMLPVLIPVFVLVPVIKQPQGVIATVLSLLPPFSPILMVLRLSTPEGAPGWQVAVSLCLVAGATLLSIWIASRVFRVAILTQGQSASLRMAMRWAIRG